MGEAELKVGLVLIRRTFGYHREETRLSIRKLAKAAGLTARNAFIGAEKLVERGLFYKETDGGVTKWGVVVRDTVVVAGDTPSIKENKKTKKTLPPKGDTQKQDDLLITSVLHGSELQAELTRAYESKSRKAPLYFENIQQKEGYEVAAAALNGKFMTAVQHTIARGRLARGDLLSSLQTWVKNEKKVSGDVVKPMTRNADGSMYV